MFTDSQEVGKKLGRGVRLAVLAVSVVACAFVTGVAFAIPASYRVLEKEGFKYIIRSPANDVLVAGISLRLSRPVVRPLHRLRVFDDSFSSQEHRCLLHVREGCIDCSFL